MGTSSIQFWNTSIVQRVTMYGVSLFIVKALIGLANKIFLMYRYIDFPFSQNWYNKIFIINLFILWVQAAELL